MKSHYTIISAVVRPEIQEKSQHRFTVGINYRSVFFLLTK